MSFLRSLLWAAAICLAVALVVPLSVKYGGVESWYWMPPAAGILLLLGLLVRATKGRGRGDEGPTSWISYPLGICVLAYSWVQLHDTAHRSHVDQARVNVAEIANAYAAASARRYVDDPSVHRCIRDERLSGRVGPTPAMTVACHLGPDERCVFGEAPYDDGEYARGLWEDSPVWSQINFLPEQGVQHHYEIRWAESKDERGNEICQFTAMAFGDLDADGSFSTYERAGVIDEMGHALGQLISEPERD